MKDYEEFPDTLSLNTIFFLGNPQAFTVETLNKFHRLLLENKRFFSLERLIKGKERALVIFGPRELPGMFPELNLIELEDYLGEVNPDAVLTDSEKKVDLNQSITWLVEPKNSLKKVMHVGNQLKELSIGPQQKVFIQIIGEPLGDKDGLYFQSTIRIMIADLDAVERVNLTKNVNLIFQEATGLNKRTDNFPEAKKFDSFKQRTRIPKEVADFKLTSQEIFDILV